jgi:hypothetical protein
MASITAIIAENYPYGAWYYACKLCKRKVAGEAEVLFQLN